MEGEELGGHFFLLWSISEFKDRTDAAKSLFG